MSIGIAECKICYEDKASLITHCGEDGFCRDCLERFSVEKEACPFCRAELELSDYLTKDELIEYLKGKCATLSGRVEALEGENATLTLLNGARSRDDAREETRQTLSVREGAILSGCALGMTVVIASISCLPLFFLG